MIADLIFHYSTGNFKHSEAVFPDNIKNVVDFRTWLNDQKDFISIGQKIYNKKNILFITVEPKEVKND